MGVRTVDVLRRLRDRRRTTEEIAIALDATDDSVERLLGTLKVVGLVYPSSGQWTLTRRGRVLLELSEARAELRRNPGLAHMMRSNRGITDH